MQAQPRPDVPAAIIIGPLMVVTPNERATLTAVMWGDIACALIADNDDHPELAEAFIGLLESRLGTHKAHREALIQGGDAVLARIGAQRQRRIELSQQRAKRLRRGTVERYVTEGVEEMLERAAKHRDDAASLEAADQRTKAAGGKLQNRAKVKEHLTAARRLEIEAEATTRSDTDQRWVGGAIRETTELAQARGEEVETDEAEFNLPVRDLETGEILRHRSGDKKGQQIYKTERFTRTTLSSRGRGLETALDKGHLDGRGPKAEALFDIGVKYRDAYEIDEGKRGSGGQGSGGFGPKGPQLRIVEAGETLQILRKDLSIRERQVLDLVCGQDMRARQAGVLLKRGFPSVRLSLRAGLQAALKSWTEAHKAGEVGVAADRVRQVDGMIRKMRRP